MACEKVDRTTAIYLASVLIRHGHEEYELGDLCLPTIDCLTASAVCAGTTHADAYIDGFNWGQDEDDPGAAGFSDLNDGAIGRLAARQAAQWLLESFVDLQDTFADAWTRRFQARVQTAMTQTGDRPATEDGEAGR